MNSNFSPESQTFHNWIQTFHQKTQTFVTKLNFLQTTQTFRQRFKLFSSRSHHAFFTEVLAGRWMQRESARCGQLKDKCFVRTIMVHGNWIEACLRKLLVTTDFASSLHTHVVPLHANIAHCSHFYCGGSHVSIETSKIKDGMCSILDMEEQPTGIQNARVGKY